MLIFTCYVWYVTSVTEFAIHSCNTFFANALAKYILNQSTKLKNIFSQSHKIGKWIADIIMMYLILKSLGEEKNIFFQTRELIFCAKPFKNFHPNNLYYIIKLEKTVTNYRMKGECWNKVYLIKTHTTIPSLIKVSY